MTKDRSLHKTSSYLGLTALCLTVATACTDPTGTFSGSSLKAQIPATASKDQGKTEYFAVQNSDSCSTCHGAQGQGTDRGNALVNCQNCKGSFDDLRDHIHFSMPEQDWRLCDEENSCAENTAAFILCTFNPDHTEGCPPPAEAVIPGPEAAKPEMLARGRDEYKTPDPWYSCSTCHGENGAGSYSLISSQGGCGNCNGTFEELANYIATDMPPIPFGLDPESCSDTNNSTCATDSAAYIFCCFNPGLADGCPTLDYSVFTECLQPQP